MNSDDRVKAVAEFGFTERQAGFLVTVMLHSGVCVPRQYASFAGTAYGHKVTRFFEKLVQRDFATVCDCLHVVRQRGSHRQFKHRSKPGLVTVVGKPGDDLAPGTLNSVLKQAGLKP